MNGVHINKYIRKWLTQSQDVTDIVPATSIVPLVAAPTSQPFITFQHGPVEPDYTKDGVVIDRVQVMIVCCSNDYEQSIDIAAAVRDTLEYQSYTDEDIYIPIIQIEEITEDVVNDTYVQQILISFEIQNKRN